jgi:ABC-type antimicrobial peptide transport system permease subunit
VAGRAFRAQDDSTAPGVIIVSEGLARRIFGTPGAALGRRLRFYAFPDSAYEVVGVAGDVMTARLDAQAPITIYYPHLQSAENRMTVAIRVTGDPVALMRAATDVARALDPQLPIYQLRTMEQAVQDSPAVFARRYPLLLLAAFAAIALLLALVGVYGVVAYSVAQRLRELAIRIALGATSRSILVMVLRQGAVLAALGIAGGVLLSLVLGRFLAAVLFDVRAMDVLTHAGVAAMLAAAAMLATLLPARRAVATDPTITLRAE